MGCANSVEPPRKTTMSSSIREEPVQLKYERSAISVETLDRVEPLESVNFQAG